MYSIIESYFFYIEGNLPHSSELNEYSQIGHFIKGLWENIFESLL